jgi:hypothetical protein
MTVSRGGRRCVPNRNREVAAARIEMIDQR